MKNKGEPYKIRKLPASTLAIDHSYQRDTTKAHYRRIARDLDFDSLGIFVVSARGDGSFVVVDGQHRLMALREQQVDEWEVLCRVYSDLNREQEASLYRTLNRTRKTSAWDDFKAGLVEGDKDCLAIKRIAHRTGWKVCNQVGDNKVCCISTLRTIFAKKGGALALEHSLQDARAAWGGSPIGVEKTVLQGLSVVHSTYDGALDRPALVQKLSKIKGGPAGILGTARQLKEIRPESLFRLCSWVIVQNYNKGRRQSQLPPL